MTPKDISETTPVRLLILQASIALTAMSLLFCELGWPLNTAQEKLSETITWSLILLALIAEIGLAAKTKQSLRRRKIIFTVLGVLTITRILVEFPLRAWLENYITPRGAALAALALVQLTLIVPFSLRMLRVTRLGILRTAKPATLFAFSFFLAILFGTILLMTPEANKFGISWIDALFTSASAICVTGLIVVDTGTAFTTRGHFIILALIQVGGIGIMTLTYFLSLMTGQGISLRDRARLKELFSEDNAGAMGRFLARTVALTLTIEIAGAFLIYFSWIGQPARQGHEVWDSLFHSVSAFCNAGFSTFTNGLAEPGISENRALQTVIMLLIVSGGLGFAVLQDIPRILWRSIQGARQHFPVGKKIPHVPFADRRIRLHTRLTLRTTGALLIGGTIMFLVAERSELSAGRIWEATFASVTARTAGFNITDMSVYSFSTVVLFCFLMFVGGSPGGTAGGVKTTTFAIAVGELGRLIQGRQTLHLHGRRIPREIVDRCSSTIVVSLIWIAVSIFLLSWSHPNLDPIDIVFECFSAFGTVGLTRGITAELSAFGKLIIIATMFAGRVGLLTLILAFTGQPKPRRYELPPGRLPLN